MFRIDHGPKCGADGDPFHGCCQFFSEAGGYGEVSSGIPFHGGESLGFGLGMER